MYKTLILYTFFLITLQMINLYYILLYIYIIISIICTARPFDHRQKKIKMERNKVLISQPSPLSYSVTLILQLLKLLKLSIRYWSLSIQSLLWAFFLTPDLIFSFLKDDIHRTTIGIIRYLHFLYLPLSKTRYHSWASLLSQSRAPSYPHSSM